MPQADLSYSASIEFDGAKALAVVEEVIKSFDTTSGDCKGRAIVVPITHHDHVLLRVAVLEKPHRDQEFMSGLCQNLADALKPMIPAETLFNVEVSFLSTYNLTVM